MVSPRAVVTGANRGIGLEIARGLSEAGFEVIVAGRSLQRAAAAAEELGPRTGPFQLDVTDPDDVDRLVAELSDRGGVDVLVNNAGVYLEAPHVPDAAPNRITDQPIEVFRTTMETNLYGPVRLMRAMAPLMAGSGGGRIVNVSSRSGQLSSMGAGDGAYAVSKAALNAATKIFAAELAEQGITVNAMCPGWVHTEMGGPAGDRTPTEGADTAVWLATLPDDDRRTGGFFAERAPTPW